MKLCELAGMISDLLLDCFVNASFCGAVKTALQ